MNLETKKAVFSRYFLEYTRLKNFSRSLEVKWVPKSCLGFFRDTTWGSFPSDESRSKLLQREDQF